MVRRLRGGYCFPRYNISPKACSDIPRQHSFTLGDLTPVKYFILLLQTASQSLSLPSQHFVIRRSPPLRTFTVTPKKCIPLKAEVEEALPIHKTVARTVRRSEHSVSSLWSSPGPRDTANSEIQQMRKKTTLHLETGGGGENAKKRNPASRAVRQPDFLASDWFQKGKNYSANTTIISCLATAQ